MIRGCAWAWAGIGIEVSSAHFSAHVTTRQGERARHGKWASVAGRDGWAAERGSGRGWAPATHPASEDGGTIRRPILHPRPAVSCRACHPSSLPSCSSPQHTTPPPLQALRNQAAQPGDPAAGLARARVHTIFDGVSSNRRSAERWRSACREIAAPGLSVPFPVPAASVRSTAALSQRHPPSAFLNAASRFLPRRIVDDARTTSVSATCASILAKYVPPLLSPLSLSPLSSFPPRAPYSTLCTITPAAAFYTTPSYRPEESGIRRTIFGWPTRVGWGRNGGDPPQNPLSPLERSTA